METAQDTFHFPVEPTSFHLSRTLNHCNKNDKEMAGYSNSYSANTRGELNETDDNEGYVGVTFYYVTVLGQIMKFLTTPHDSKQLARC